MKKFKPPSHNTFIPLLDWMKYYNVVIAITDKGTGKSVRACRAVIDLALKYKHSTWLRNWETEIHRSVIDPLMEELASRGELCVSNRNDFNQINEELKKQGKPPFIRYWTGSEKGIKCNWPDRKPEVIVMFAYTSRLGSFAGCNHKSELVVYDEFIAGRLLDGHIENFTMSDFCVEFMKFLKTLTRPKPLKLLMLANGHLSENDLISGLGWDVDWDKLANGEDTWYEAERGGNKILGYWSPVPWKIPELLGSNSQIDNLFIHKNGSGETDQLFQYLPNEYKRVIPFDNKRWDIPCYAIYYEWSFFIVWKSSTDQTFYIQQSDIKRIDQLGLSKFSHKSECLKLKVIPVLGKKKWWDLNSEMFTCKYQTDLVFFNNEFGKEIFELEVFKEAIDFKFRYEYGDEDKPENRLKF